MAHNRTQDLLMYQEVPYRSIWHSVAFSAQKKASTAHISGNELAKPVIVKSDNQLCMVVLPATMLIDVKKLRKVLGSKNIRLANESEFKNLFPDCEVGAMPPFGHLYGLDTYVADRLTHDELIAFNAGTHNELIEMTFRDYERLEHPHVVKLD